MPLVVCSVLDTRALARTMTTYGVRGVVHLAAKKSVSESVRKPLYYYDQNVRGTASVLAAMRATFDDAWADGESGITERLRLLGYPASHEFVDQAGVQAVPRSIFGGHLQLLDCWLTYQPPASRWRTRKYTAGTERDWHRDFTFVGADPGRPLIVNMLLFLHDSEQAGPSR